MRAEIIRNLLKSYYSHKSLFQKIPSDIKKISDIAEHQTTKRRMLDTHEVIEFLTFDGLKELFYIIYKNNSKDQKLCELFNAIRKNFQFDAGYVSNYRPTFAEDSLNAFSLLEHFAEIKLLNDALFEFINFYFVGRNDLFMMTLASLPLSDVLQLIIENRQELKLLCSADIYVSDECFEIVNLLRVNNLFSDMYALIGLEKMCKLIKAHDLVLLQQLKLNELLTATHIQALLNNPIHLCRDKLLLLSDKKLLNKTTWSLLTKGCSAENIIALSAYKDLELYAHRIPNNGDYLLRSLTILHEEKIAECDEWVLAEIEFSRAMQGFLAILSKAGICTKTNLEMLLTEKNRPKFLGGAEVLKALQGLQPEIVTEMFLDVMAQAENLQTAQEISAYILSLNLTVTANSLLKNHSLFAESAILKPVVVEVQPDNRNIATI